MGPGLKSLSCRTATGSGFGRRRAVLSKGTMMPLERRSEPQMLRQFQKMYLTPLMRRRHQELMEARALNEWLANRRLQQEGETYADEIGRMTEAVNRRIPQWGRGAAAAPVPGEEACAELAALEKAVASQLSDRSLDEPKLFGRRQTTSDVQERFVSCLKTSTRGNPFIKVKVLLDRVCLWDAEQRPLEEVRDLSNRMCKLRAELKQVWMMSGQCGLLIEVTDLMLRDEEPQRCPF